MGNAVNTIAKARLTREKQGYVLNGLSKIKTRFIHLTTAYQRESHEARLMFQESNANALKVLDVMKWLHRSS